MSELLPTAQAQRIRDGLLAYLVTTFALADADAADALDNFLSDPASGMFKGPYVRLRLPFRPADDGWRDALEWYEGFTPYGHQAAAFARLSSAPGGRRRRPEPTLVTTGTGSGKTEAFLYPILDHVLRTRRDGVRGMKALILYPMNALANDQAQRLTTMLTEHAELGGVTAGLYIGQSGPSRTSVTVDGLITDREVIRDDPPDILLTNYKMLDQLLLRRADQKIWRTSATSLQYLVLDEFHSYDGAQGTDVAMLLRRLGLALKGHWVDDNPTITDEDRARPLGRITPVATSATLGDKGDPDVMLDFARTVFGEEFGPESVVTESRLRLDEWVGGARVAVDALGLAPVDVGSTEIGAANAELRALTGDPDPAALARTVLRHLYSGGDTALGALVDRADGEGLLLAARAHPLVQALVADGSDAAGLETVAARVLGRATTSPAELQAAQAFVADVVAMLGHVRAEAGRDALSVETHLWVRELTRVDRAADSVTRFRWSDDGPPVAGEGVEDVRPSYPAVFCRHCGRSGWGVNLTPQGNDVAPDDPGTIRRRHAMKDGRFRAVVYAPGEADRVFFQKVDVEGLRWFSVRDLALLDTAPDDDDPEFRDGWVLPVLTVVGKDDDKRAREDECPACGQEDGIRFLGSAIATLLSVSLSTLFGSGVIDANEKKALVFTDSVQDAAHRAGFVQARSHTLTLRALLREAVADGSLGLDELVTRVMRTAGDDPVARYRIIAPDCADRPSFTPFWTAARQGSVPVAARRRVQRRLAFDAMREFGLNSRTGRTLELTGTVAAAVDANAPSAMAQAARTVLQGFALEQTLDGEGGEPSDAQLVQWVRGVLERMRTQGAIDHDWFQRYRMEDGKRWSIWGGRPRHEGMPGFGPGLPAPAYPRVGSKLEQKDQGLDPVTSARSWYARWTSRVLPVSPTQGGILVKLLLERLAKDGVLSVLSSQTNAAVYAIPPERVVVGPIDLADLVAGRHQLVCDTCQVPTPGTAEVVDQLDDAPCLVARCDGRLRRQGHGDNFYRTLYSSPDMRRVVAREHTGLLDDETRLLYENGFKSSQTDPQAPNVLVATPTLEMGIDIGDLSTVFLSSLPRTVASYVQRVGRAGRLTGNALDLAYVTGRGEHLPKLGDPLSVINGEVRPPATYLEADEILQRQYTAHLMDAMARDVGHTAPKKATEVMGSSEPGSFLGDLIELAERDAETHLDGFLGAFDSLGRDAEAALRAWATPQAGPGTSDLAARVHDASGRWQQTVQTLKHRLDAIEKVLPELEAKAESAAKTDDDVRAFRSARTARKLTLGQLSGLRGEYWIGVMEQYGLLPNYTLLDDSVTLDVGLSWIDPDTNTFESDHVQLTRGAAQAIREFAPGAKFYARGTEIAIDALDLGMDGESIRPWVFCPACGYGVDVEAGGAPKAVASCPRCGSTDIADVGQQIEVVELRHVSAEVIRDEAMITDRSDERDRAQFQLFATADVDPAQIARRWFVEKIGLGCTYMRQLDVRWINAGLPGHGVDRTIGGVTKQAALFRVCAGCGKLDSESGRNRRHEHRPWCGYRDALDENTRSVALSRTLRTQGLLLRLPRSVTTGDMFAIPSLSAAILLGLREQIGGHPDHLQIEQVVDPTLTDGSDNHEALLLHDIVPGGTGYLSELAEPERLRDLLVRAWDRVRTCECRGEERLACHRCLLPFAPPYAVPHVSRAAAERHLGALLGLPQGAESAAGVEWVRTDEPVADPFESHLELKFREVMLDRLSRASAAIQQVPGPWGNTIKFTFPGNPRQWLLRPQPNVENSKPDFALESNDPNVPTVYVFVDGHTFHATVAHNRMADDAFKREILRGVGHVVLGVSGRDLGPDVASAAWYSDTMLGKVMANPTTTASPADYERLRHGPVDWLMAWTDKPFASSAPHVARGVALLMLPISADATAPADLPLPAVADRILRGLPLTGTGATRAVKTWRQGPLVVAFEVLPGNVVPMAVVLDDRDESIDVAHADAWRAWLSLSNALALRDWPTTITTVTRLAAEATSTALAPVIDDADAVGLDAPWLEIFQQAVGDDERHLIIDLGARGVPVPVLGFETDEGIPLDVSWPDRMIAVEVVAKSDEDRNDLAAAGWTLVSADADSVAAVLGAGDAHDNPEVDG